MAMAFSTAAEQGPADCVQERLIPKGELFVRLESGPDTGSFVFCYPNGNIRRRGTNIAGKVEGVYELYHSNGQLEVRMVYSAGVPNDGKATYYDKQGHIKRIIPTLNGKRHGDLVWFWPNGNIKLVAKYQNGDMVSDRHYSENGDLEQEMTY